MRIWLARHGETDWNVRLLMQGTTDTELNDNGRQQAQRLGEAMENRNLVRVFTSPLKRAYETGKAVADRLGIPCEAVPGLEEICMGDWEGRVWTDVCSEEPEAVQAWVNDRRNVRPPKGENYQEVLDRFIAAMLYILRRAEGDVMVVSHNGSIRAFLAELNGTPLETMNKDYSTPNAEAIEVDAQRVLDRFAK